MEFKRIIGLCGIALLAGVFGTGCGSKNDATSQTPDLDGLWLLSITQEFGRADYRDVSTVLLRIQQEDGVYHAKIEGNKPALPDPVLKSFDVTGNKVKLVLKSDLYTYDFEGVIQGSTIRGNMDQGGLIIEPARLQKTQMLDISEAIDFPKTARNLEYQVVLESASQGESEEVSLADHFDSFDAFCKKHAETPLAVIFSHKLVDAAPSQVKTEAELKTFAKQYLKRAALWGERMEMLARYNLGRSLCRKPEFAKLGLAYLEEAEAQMDAARRDEVKDELAVIRQMVKGDKTRSQAAKAFALAKAGDEEGLKTLRELNEDALFDPVVIYQRAEAARLLGEAEEALRLNARLAVWPRLQAALQQEPVWQAGERKLPESLLVELNAQLYPESSGLGRFKNQIFDEAVYLIADRLDLPKTEPKKGNRISVVELFTGAGCIPCVAADLATAALEKTYSDSNLIVLRYHLHSAGFDPLAHPRNIDRFQSLLEPDRQEYLATPTVFINGQRTQSNVGGSLKDAVRIAGDLQSELRPLFEESSPLKLDLSAKQLEDEITISAKVTGVEGHRKESLRVHLILAEEQINYPAANGIRRHEMLVRWFANEGKAIPFSSAGEFAYTEQTRVSEIRELLKSSNESAAKAMDVELESAPLLLEKLKLVGLVQDSETREILGAALVPVEFESALEREFEELLKPSQTGPSFGPKLEKPETESPPDEEPAETKPLKEQSEPTGPQLLLPTFSP